MKLSLVGISHRHAPVELRERVALDARQSAALARELAEGGGECVCLSTCNRTELYTVGDDAESRALETLQTLGGEEVAALSYRLRDQAAASISSASPRASTRSSRAKGRSSARCALRTRQARPGRC